MDTLVRHADTAVWDAIAAEKRRQQQGLEMIASENYASSAVMAAQGPVLTNKKTAYVINIARGGLIKTGDLLEALDKGVIAGAGLDVTDPEPLPADHPLWKKPNVVISPHIGGQSPESMKRQWRLYRENVRRFVAGEPLLCVVDKARGY